jgi:hypothetical protein
MVTSALIDASVLAMPSQKANEIVIRQFISGLTDWSEMVNGGFLRIYTTKRLAEVLWQLGRYPDFPALKLLFQDRGPNFPYSANEVRRIVAGLENKAQSFEQEFGIESLLSSDERISPDVREQLEHACLQSELLENLIILVLLHTSRGAKNHSLLVGSYLNASTVHIEAQVEDADCGKGIFPLTFPYQLNGDILLLTNAHDLLLDLKASELFLASLDEQDMLKSFQVRLFQVRFERGENPIWSKLPYMPLGHNFVDSAVQYIQAGKDPDKLLRAMCDVFDELPAKTHQLRIDKSGGSPQKIRETDGARAWRRDVDQASHLHYWKCTKDRIEFANVTTEHDDMTIIS